MHEGSRPEVACGVASSEDVAEAAEETVLRQRRHDLHAAQFPHRQACRKCKRLSRLNSQLKFGSAGLRETDPLTCVRCAMRRSASKTLSRRPV